MNGRIIFLRINRSGNFYRVGPSLRYRNGRDVLSRKELVAAVGEDVVDEYDRDPVLEIVGIVRTMRGGRVEVQVGGTAGASAIMDVEDIQKHYGGEKLLHEYMQSWWPVPEHLHERLRDRSA